MHAGSPSLLISVLPSLCSRRVQPEGWFQPPFLPKGWQLETAGREVRDSGGPISSAVPPRGPHLSHCAPQGVSRLWGSLEHVDEALTREV